MESNAWISAKVRAPASRIPNAQTAAHAPAANSTPPSVMCLCISRKARRRATTDILPAGAWGLLKGKHFEDTRVLRHALPRLAPELAIAVADQAAPAGHHCDVLLTFGLVADDPAVVALTIVVAPQLLAGAGIVGYEHAVG